jgi:2-polyprenyl-3-methyl-5-hydroxy-6-metoxy-1,4-benzoquinol methylase
MLTCISCLRSGDLDPLTEKTVQNNYRIRLVKCRHCGLVFLENPLPYEDMLRLCEGSWAFYDHPLKSDEDEISARVSIIEYSEQMAVCESGRLLELGCAKGYLLAAARRRGWDVWGIECNRRCADYGNQVLGVRIIQGDIMKALNTIHQPFDIIVLWHILEHIPCPRDLLLKLREKLCRQGVMALQVPDYEKLGDSIVGTYHVSYFTRESISNLMDECGMEIMSYDYDDENKFISMRVKRASH